MVRVIFCVSYLLSGIAQALTLSDGQRDLLYQEFLPELASHKLCVKLAAQLEGVDELVLMGILGQERGYKNPVKRNNNGTFDHGVAHINTVREKELKHFPFDLEETIFNPCASILAAAHLVSTEIKQANDVWQGVGNYHYDIRGKHPRHHWRYRDAVKKRVIRMRQTVQ